MSCILCKSEKVILKETVKKEDLFSGYRKISNVNLGPLVKQDLKLMSCSNCSLMYYDPVISGNEDFYNSLQEKPWYYVDQKLEYKTASEYIKPQMRVLDIGCGRGAFSSYVENKAATFIGLEKSANAQVMAENNKIKIIVDDIENFANEYPSSVDVACAFQVCEHVEDVGKFIQSMIKSVKINGKIIISLPSYDSFLGMSSNVYLNMPPHHLSLWRDSVFKSMEEIFNIELETIHHEKLEYVHKHWYFASIIQSLFLKPKLIDKSYRRRFFSKLSGLISRAISGRIDDKYLGRGHTVTAVFKVL
mgnify:CR=1 FL=1